MIAAKEAIEIDDADTLVIGCTRMFAATELSDDFRAAGLDVPIIDPIPLTIKFAKTLVELGLGHSKYAFPTPAWVHDAQSADHRHEVNPASLKAVRG